MLVILEDLGETGSVTREYMLEREQYYLDILFNKFPTLKLNTSPTAGTTQGFKNSEDFKLNRTGELNPMHPVQGRTFSPEFLAMQKADRTGAKNSQFGVKKSAATLAKITKLVYVYKYDTMEFLGEYPTVICKKEFNVGYDTLKKYIANSQPFKNKLFSLKKLH